jgi:membrane protease YdiL (CAAX protease family)
MMDLLWSVIYSVTVGLLTWTLYAKIGKFPIPLPRSKKPQREVLEALFLWGLAFTTSMLMAVWIIPTLDHHFMDRTLRELVIVPLFAVIYIALPIFIVVKLNGWTLKDFGLTLKSQSRSVAIFAVILGIVTGSVAYINNQAVMGIDLLPWGALFLLVFTNSFTEEFFHRGVILSLLERAIGQKGALLWGGILFGLTHVVFDVTKLMDTNGILYIAFALLLQTMAGWLFGIIYMKTRTLWPGIVFHYLVNWLPSILMGIAK